MNNQDIFKILLLILLLCSTKIDENGNIDYSSINNLIILLLLFSISPTSYECNTTQNTTF